MKLKVFLAVLVLVILASLFFLPLIKLSYTVRSQGIIYPIREWVLAKADDGLLTHTLHDNFNHAVAYHAITEFQRGDHGEFVLYQKVFRAERVNFNDTIGFLRSNEEQRLLMQLTGQLDVNRRMLEVYASGERAEDVAVVRERVNLAEKEFETQEKLFERAERLLQEKVISPQDHELARNEFEVKRMALQIARSEYEAIQAGAKPEQIELARAEIRSLESQIQQMQSRLDAFIIRAPFAGIILRDGPEINTSEKIIRVADDSSFIVVLPVETHHLPYIQTGQKITLSPETREEPVQATIAAIGNSVQIINRRQNVFITAVLDQHPSYIFPRMLIQAEINTGSITLREYARRLVKTIYAN